MSISYNWNRINNALSNAILQAGRLDALLNDLGCNLKSHRHVKYRGPCPVHGGDSDSMCLEVGEGDKLPIRWNCFSNQCHIEFKPSLLGLVRGILSAQQGDKVHPKVAVDYLYRFIGDAARINADIPASNAVVPPKLLNFPREMVRKRLTIPSPYFLSRGFSPEVLDAFDVGESVKQGRAVVPLYDNDEGRTCIGYLGRSYRPRCDQCGNHHDGPECHYGQPRWKLPEGFPSDQYLFNYARAKTTSAPFIFLVEGVGDVLRLSEARFVGVALIGSEISNERLRMLKGLGKMIWVAFDNDDGGEKARKRFVERVTSSGLQLPYVDFQAPAPYKDIGETPVAELQAAVISRMKGYLIHGEELVADGDSWGRRTLDYARQQLEDTLSRMITATF